MSSLRKRLSQFVKLTYQFIMYTDSREDLVRPWFDLVRRLQVPDVDSAHGVLVGVHAAVLGVCGTSGIPTSLARLRGKGSSARRSRPLATLRLRAELANERPALECLNAGGGSAA